MTAEDFKFKFTMQDASCLRTTHTRWALDLRSCMKGARQHWFLVPRKQVEESTTITIWLSIQHVSSFDRNVNALPWPSLSTLMETNERSATRTTTAKKRLCCLLYSHLIWIWYRRQCVLVALQMYAWRRCCYVGTVSNARCQLVG